MDIFELAVESVLQIPLVRDRKQKENHSGQNIWLKTHMKATFPISYMLK